MMKINLLSRTWYRTLLFFVCMLAIPTFTYHSALGAGRDSANDSVNHGYYALRLFLQDEQYLTAIRRAKMVISFKGISDDATTLVDEISDYSEQALQELEALTRIRPVIVFNEVPDEWIGKATLDSLRWMTAKEFLLEAENFEKNLLLSQLHILRVISHLAKQLKQEDDNLKRKEWLANLSIRYESYYQRVYAMITIKP